MIPSNPTSTEQRECPDCGKLFPISEFEYSFYCRQSEGMENDTDELCTECRREANAQEADDQRRAACGDYSKL